jgi:TRAP-type mannitol/chloroaromatic compound transport system permease large subunit
LIFYGLVTETSIKALFTASFIPGFMLASFFIIYILVVTRLKPETAPLPEPSADDIAAGEKRLMFLGFLSRFSMWITGVIFFRALFFTVTGENIIQEGVDPIFLGMVSDLPYIAGAFLISLALVYFVVGKERTKIGWDMGKGLIAPTVVIGVVLGSIYGGITGITEAAGMGVIAVFVIGLIRREMTFEIVWDAVMRTLKSTGTIIWVTIGAAALAAAYTLVGGPTYIANLIIGYELPTMGVILFMMLIFLIMGMFMDWVGIVLLIMPVFLPIVKKLPIQDIGVFGTIEPKHIAVWFGVVFCMNMQVSFLSPPFGPAAFYLKSVAPAHISLTDIFRGFLPFIAIQLVALSVLLLWPRIVTILL